MEHLVERMPEFRPVLDDHLDFSGGENLFHMLMGDLGRFYMSTARHESDLSRRYWMAVEKLASEGDDDVENAVGVSLIEWFAWGDEGERAALIAAQDWHGPATRNMVVEYTRE